MSELPELFPIAGTILALFALGLLDSYLTQRGHQGAGEGQEALRLAEYELNPLHQRSVRDGRWLDLRHLLGLLLISLLVAAGGLLAPTWLPALQGITITPLVLLNVQHLENLATFRLYRRYPRQYSGRLRIGQPLGLRLAAVRHAAVAALVVAAALIERSMFWIASACAAGAMVGYLQLLATLQDRSRR
jgi:hypothetical protein